jgi:hypothetical protein
MKDGSGRRHDAGRGIMDDEYGQLATTLAQSGERWAAPLVASLRSRILYLALFKECVRVAHERSDRGARFELQEDASTDQFALLLEPRRIRFERYPGHPVVAIHREGFPPELVPGDLGSESIEAPFTHEEALLLARHQVNMALRLLFRRFD